MFADPCAMLRPRPFIALVVCLVVSEGLFGCRPAAPKAKTQTAARPEAARNNSAELPPAQSLASITKPSDAVTSPAAKADDKANDKSDDLLEGNDSSLSSRSPSREAGDIASPAPHGEQPVSAERIVLLAPGGPLLVDLIITIDGQAADRLFAEMVDDAGRAGDTNGDGQTTWQEVTTSAALRYGNFGNLASDNEEERPRLIQLYDANRNGLADRDELARFITRNSGSARAFSFKSSNYYRDKNRTESPTWQLLDADRNGRLSQEEQQQASEFLKRYDFNNDDLIYLADLMPPTGDEPAPLMSRRSGEAETAFAVSQLRDWSMVLYAMEEIYALRQPLTLDNFSRDPALFKQLDADTDGHLDADEIAQLAHVDAHVRLALRFGGAVQGSEDDKTPLLPAMEILDQPRGKHTLVSSTASDRMTVVLPDTRLTMVMRDEAARLDGATQAADLLAQYDGDNNGYLQPDEVPPLVAMQLGSFEAMDADADGKLQRDEVAGFLDRRRLAVRLQIRARAGEERDIVFAALDQNFDGRLSAREIYEAPQALAQRATVVGEPLDVAALPAAMLVVVGRGDPQADQQLFNLRPPVQQATAGAADWFIAMDTNQDGEVSRREFLGEAALFARWDHDGDGLLTVSESQAIGAAP